MVGTAAPPLVVKLATLVEVSLGGAPVANAGVEKDGTPVARVATAGEVEDGT